MRTTLILVAMVALLSACQENFDEKCRREAQTYTQKFCPQKVDDQVTLDSTAYDARTRTYRYHYTVAAEANTPEVRENIRRQEADFRSKLLLLLINSVQLKPYKDRGIVFEYVYAFAGEREPFMRIRFSEKDYNHRVAADKVGDRADH